MDTTAPGQQPAAELYAKVASHAVELHGIRSEVGQLRRDVESDFAGLRQGMKDLQTAMEQGQRGPLNRFATWIGALLVIGGGVTTVFWRDLGRVEDDKVVQWRVIAENAKESDSGIAQVLAAAMAAINTERDRADAVLTVRTQKFFDGLERIDNEVDADRLKLETTSRLAAEAMAGIKDLDTDLQREMDNKDSAITESVAGLRNWVSSQVDGVHKRLQDEFNDRENDRTQLRNEQFASIDKQIGSIVGRIEELEVWIRDASAQSLRHRTENTERIRAMEHDRQRIEEAILRLEAKRK